MTRQAAHALGQILGDPCYRCWGRSWAIPVIDVGADPGRSLLSMLTNLVCESFAVVGQDRQDQLVVAEPHTAGRHLRPTEHKALDALIAMELQPVRQPAAHTFYLSVAFETMLLCQRTGLKQPMRR